MRYQVPQFVDIEDKIIGPLTLKQFLIYITAVMLLIPVYLASDLSLFITMAIPAIGLAALFAHFKLHGKSLFQILGHAVGFFFTGQLFIWRRTGQDKTLMVRGPEYDDISLLLQTSESYLSERSRTIQTIGNVVNEDVEDPIEELETPAMEIPK